MTDEYIVGEDEIVRALWAVSASNEDIDNYAGTLQIGSASAMGPAPGVEDTEARFRTFYSLGRNIRLRNYPEKLHFAYPDFNKADYGNGIVYGSIIIGEDHWQWRNILASELGNPSGLEARFRAVYDWAKHHSYGGGMPNMHQADYGNGKVYGTILFSQESLEWKNVSKNQLGNPSDVGERFKAVHSFASNNGYPAGFPNFHQADYGDGTVYGILLFKPGYAKKIDINFSVCNVLGSSYNFEDQIAATPYGSLFIPGLDAGSPQLTIPVP